MTVMWPTSTLNVTAMWPTSTYNVTVMWPTSTVDATAMWPTSTYNVAVKWPTSTSSYFIVALPLLTAFMLLRPNAVPLQKSNPRAPDFSPKDRENGGTALWIEDKRTPQWVLDHIDTGLPAAPETRR
jgi:hypothetical protein